MVVLTHQEKEETNMNLKEYLEVISNIDSFVLCVPDNEEG